MQDHVQIAHELRIVADAEGQSHHRLVGRHQLRPVRRRFQGGEAAQDWARLANAYPPVLRTHDRYGHRVDEVEFHPSWHELMTVAVEAGARP